MKKLAVFLLFFSAFLHWGCAKKESKKGLQVANLLVINLENSDPTPGEPYHFGTVYRETTREAKFFVTNPMEFDATEITASPLESGFSFKGGNYPGEGGDCSATLGAGNRCAIVVSYSPTSSGASNSTIKLTYKIELNQLVSEMSVTGMGKSRALLAFQSANISFGSRGIGSVNLASVTLKNLGDEDVNSLTFSAASTPFSITKTCSAVSAKQSCTLQVQFVPKTASDSEMKLTLEYSDGNTSQRLVLSVSGSGDNGNFNLSKGFDRAVYALSVEDSGYLFAGGDFQSYASSAASGIIRLRTASEPDTTFAVGDGFIGSVYAVAPTSSGKIYVGGNFTSYRGNPVNSIARLNADGSLDSSFQTDSGFNGNVYSLKMDASGNIYVGGDFTRYNSTASPLLIRLKSDGRVDTDFSVGTGLSGTAVYTLALDLSNKLYVGGRFNTYQRISSPNLISILSNGSLDTSFNVSAGMNSTVRSIVVTPNQSVYIAGEFTAYGSVVANRLLRLNANGTVDSAFAVGTALDGPANVLQLSNDGAGKIYIGGNFSSFNGSSVTSVIRVNPNGTWDSTFPTTQDLIGSVFTLGQDESGNVYLGGSISSFHGFPVNRLAKLRYSGALDKNYNLGAGLNLETAALLPLKDGSGSVIVGGQFTTYQGTARNRAVKLGWNGKIDGTFNSSSGFNGKVIKVITDPKDSNKLLIAGDFTAYNGTTAARLLRTDLNGVLDSSLVTGSGFNASILTLESAGESYYVGGDFTSYNGTPANRLIRLFNNGSVDAAFQTGTGFNGTVHAVSFTNDGSGKVYVGGSFTNYNGFSVNRIVRLFPDGTVDWGFNSGTGFDDTVNVILALSGNSKLYIGGSFSKYKGSVANSLIRINSNGAMDTSFDIGAGFDKAVLALQESQDSSRSLMVGGSFLYFQGSKTNSVARLTSSGTYDRSFATGKGFNGTVNAIQLAQDGSKDIYFGGAFSSYNGVTTDSLVRLDPTGRLE